MDGRRFLDQYRAFPIKVVPARWQPARLGQFIEVRPQVTVQSPQIEIGLGTLPLSIGLFAGSGLAFLIRGGLPDGLPKTAALIVGTGLAAFGIFNLVAGKPAPAGAAARKEPPLPAAGPIQPGTVSAPIPMTTEDTFSAVTARIVSPGDGTVLDVSGVGTPKIPVRVRVENASDQQAVLDLILEIVESPNPVGSGATSRQTMRVVLGGRETRDIDLQAELTTWGVFVDTVKVDLNVGRQRISGGDIEYLDAVRLTVD
jgi:hypothetical protein